MTPVVAVDGVLFVQKYGQNLERGYYEGVYGSL
jgi:hypothetical protein